MNLDIFTAYYDINWYISYVVTQVFICQKTMIFHQRKNFHIRRLYSKAMGVIREKRFGQTQFTIGGGSF